MYKQLSDVKEFYRIFDPNTPIPDAPTFLTDVRSELRYELLLEEINELIHAQKRQNMIGVADALGDILYILLGTILEYGMGEKIEQIFQAIQNANMSKLGPDGKPIYREDGKILKGPDFTPPEKEISKILSQSSYRETCPECGSTDLSFPSWYEQIDGSLSAYECLDTHCNECDSKFKTTDIIEIPNSSYDSSSQTKRSIV